MYIRRGAASEYLYNYPGPTQTFNYVNIPSKQEIVTCSSIIHGNFKDPNNWEYRIDEHTLPTINRREMRHNLSGLLLNSSEYSGNLDSGEYLPNLIDSEFSWLYNSALERLFDQLRGGLDLSVALAESGKTARMIGALANWKRYLITLGRKDFKKPYRFTLEKRIASNWLEFTYGWKPLLSDIYNVAEEMVRYTMNRIQRIRAGERAQIPTGSTYLYLGYVYQLAPLTGSAFQSFKFNVAYEIPENKFEIARFTSLNPVSIAWELLPYSFVIDWFVNIGGYLRSLETALLYESAFRGGYYTWLAVQDTQCSSAYSDNIDQSSFPTSRFYQKTIKRTSKHFRRVKLTGNPYPRTPSFKADLGWSRLVSGAALLTQFLGRK